MGHVDCNNSKYKWNSCYFSYSYILTSNVSSTFTDEHKDFSIKKEAFSVGEVNTTPIRDGEGILNLSPTIK